MTNLTFTIEQVAFVGGAAFIIGALFGIVLMACCSISNNKYDD